MEKRNLGKNGPSVAAIGYGAMVLEGYYGQSDDAQGVTTIAEAVNLGMMIDTADGYGNGHNEELVGRALAQHDGEAFIAHIVKKYISLFQDVNSKLSTPVQFLTSKQTERAHSEIRIS